MITLVCAWCLAWMGGLPRGLRLSHGICERCLARELGDDVWDLWQDVGGEG